MAKRTKKKTAEAPNVRSKVRDVAAEGRSVRDRVRNLSVEAFRDHKLPLDAVPRVVREVLDGAVKGVDESTPRSRRNVLREVFDGLSDGVHAVASAGSAVIDESRERVRAVTGKKNRQGAGRRAKDANTDFLGAVRDFADRASKSVREELESLADHAERTGPKVADSVRSAGKAADGRWLELSGESAQAGAKMARSAARNLAMGAGGFFEGLGEVLAPRDPARKQRRASGTAKKRPGGSTRKTAGKRRGS
jgi:hypothetical protein